MKTAIALALRSAAVAAGVLAPAAALAAAPLFSCAGAAMLGGAQLDCSSYLQQQAQMCTWSWALKTMDGTTQVVSGSFALAPRASNVQVWQGAGFSAAQSGPIVLCR